MLELLMVMMLAQAPGLPDERVLRDAVPIANILTSPQEYHLRGVTVQGQARHVVAVTPPTARACTPSQRLELDDGTGTLFVDYRAVIWKGSRQICPSLVEGERLVVQVEIIAQDGFHPEQPPVLAVLQSVLWRSGTQQ